MGGGGAASECDDFHIVVLINYAEYKKHNNSRSISSKMPLNIRLLLLKKISSLGCPPRIKCVPVIVTLHYHNCTKAFNSPPKLQYVSLVEF
jgi:hypothetical protein